MSKIFCNSNYVFAAAATISFILLFSTITNPVFAYDLDDVKSSIAYEEAIDEFDLPANTKNFSMELDNGLVANYYLAPNQTFVFDGVSGAITEQNDNGDNDNNGDGKKGIKYYVDVTITTTYSYPQSQDKPQDPRNDPKYDSIDWQDDDPDKNLSIKEMDKILEEKEQNDNDIDNEEGNSNNDNSSNDKDSSGGDSSGGDRSN
jgi:hypothetical protein